MKLMVYYDLSLTSCERSKFPGIGREFSSEPLSFSSSFLPLFKSYQYLFPNYWDPKLCALNLSINLYGD